MSKVLSFLKHDWLHQPWGLDLKVLIMLLVALVAVPMIYTFVIYVVAKVLHVRLGKTLGNDSQVVIGGVGNLMHEIEMLVIAKMGGHTLRNINFQTLRNMKHFRSTVAIDHNWLSHNLYETVFDFFLGTLPVYLSAMALWGVQTLFGGNTYHFHAMPKDMDVMKAVNDMKSIFFGNLTTAFATGNFFEKILYFLIVILVASTAFALSRDEIKRMISGTIVWGILLVIIWFGFAMSLHVGLLNNAIWLVMSFSAFALAHVLVYLVVILIIVYILTGYDYATVHHA